MTQATYDNLVLAIVNYQSKMNEKIVALRRQSDPAAYQREEELMMLHNIVNALAHYDLDMDVLSDSDIKYYAELASQIVHNCPF